MLKEIIIALNFVVFVWMVILFVSILLSSENSLNKIPNLRKSVLLLVFFSGLFALCTFFALYFANNIKVAGFFLRLTWGAGSFCVASYFYTTMVFVKIRKAMFWIILQFVIASIITVAAFTPVGITNIYSIYPSVRDSGFMDIFFRLWLIIVILYTLYLSLDYYVKSEDELKEDFKYYVLSIVSYVLIAIVAGGIFPLLKMTVTLVAPSIT